MGAKLSSEHTYLGWFTTSLKAHAKYFFNRGPGMRNIHVFVEDLGNAIEDVLTINVKDTKLGEVTEDVK